MLFREFIEKGLLRGELEQHEASTHLYRQGAEAESFFLLLAGSVNLTNAQENVTFPVTAPPDSLLGVMDLMNERYSHNATIRDKTSLIRISKAELLMALEQNPLLRLYLLKQMSRQEILSKSSFE